MMWLVGNVRIAISPGDDGRLLAVAAGDLFV